MRQFQVENKKAFTGYILLAYNEENLLCLIDLRNASISTSKMLSAVIEKIPKTIPEIQAYPWANGASCTECTYAVPFTEFWEKYDLKINKNRCISLWEKMSSTDKVRALNALKKYFAFAQNRNMSKKNPDTYLRNKSWEDEYQ